MHSDESLIQSCSTSTLSAIPNDGFQIRHQEETQETKTKKKAHKKESKLFQQPMTAERESAEVDEVKKELSNQKSIVANQREKINQLELDKQKTMEEMADIMQEVLEMGNTHKVYVDELSSLREKNVTLSAENDNIKAKLKAEQHIQKKLARKIDHILYAVVAITIIVGPLLIWKLNCIQSDNKLLEKCNQMSEEILANNLQQIETNNAVLEEKHKREKQTLSEQIYTLTKLLEKCNQTSEETLANNLQQIETNNDVLEEKHKREKQTLSEQIYTLTKLLNSYKIEIEVERSNSSSLAAEKNLFLKILMGFSFLAFVVGFLLVRQASTQSGENSKYNNKLSF